MTRAKYVYAANVFLGLHYFLTIYINSSFLGGFFSDRNINLLYTVGAIFNILLLLLAPKMFKAVSAKALTLLFIFFEFLTIYWLSFVTERNIVIALFIIHQALAPLILYCLDLFLESSLTNEKNTGWARAMFLTSLNVTLVASFYVVSILASSGNFSLIYTLSALALVPLAGIIFATFKNQIHSGRSLKIKEVGQSFVRNPDLVRPIIINLLLQLFYAIMIIYLPLLLKQSGFGWKEIGDILIIMILPFILLEAPLGKIFDKKTGEKEFLALGFILIFLFTLWLSSINIMSMGKSFWLFALVLFGTRVGASLLEIGSESYFFKHVTDRDSTLISLFRMTQPLSFILSPIIALPLLHFGSYSALFTTLSIVMLLGLFFIPKRDTL